MFQLLQGMIAIINECWSQNAAARLTSLRVDKKLSKLWTECKCFAVSSVVEEGIKAVLKPS